MKFKQFLATSLAAITCFSAITCSAYAETAAASMSSGFDLVEETDSNSEFIIKDQGETFSLDDFKNTVSGNDLFDVSAEESGISVYTENTAPVAGLYCLVSNPESLINGKPTTETVLIWLWKDGTNEYSYDPDGDAITVHISDIEQEYISGTVFLGEELVGFTTKITLAAQHSFLFYVTDSNGAQSNVVRYNISIEPSDGSSRPVCDVRVSTLEPYVNKKVVFDLSNSTDPDGDKITTAMIQVNDGSGYVLIGDESPYYVSKTNSSITLIFGEIRKYGVRFSVCDSRNSWSDWVEGVINVKEFSRVSLKLNCPFWDDSKTISWTEEHTTAKHTLTSRLASVYVYSERGVHLSKYTNRNGTYYNVMMYPVAPGTHFLSYESYRGSSGTEANSFDPFWGEPSNRALTEEEILEMEEEEAINYIIFDATDGETGVIIDFYSELNPIIAYKWDKPTFVIG